MCPLSDTNNELMECNASTAVWPDIQMHFDGCRTSVTARPTMESQNTLQMVPHPCDMDYMHWAANGKRLEVCSGYQGHMIASGGVYLSYPLSAETGTWEGSTPWSLASANATFWMRTYDEESGLLHVGNILTGKAYNNTLGFLGGAINSSNRVLASLAVPGGVQFFRCADRLACQMPEYTYGGSRQDPRLDLQTGLNFTELSLRRCGSIGSLLPSGCCKLDLELFPLFAYLYQNAAENSPRGCFAIWSAHDYLLPVLPLATPWHAATLSANPQSLFCDTTPLCIYNPRPTSVLQDSMRSDSVGHITHALNALFLDASSNIQALAAAQGAMQTYEDIQLCAQSVYSYTQTLQARVQALYASPVTSGFYMAFSLSLYEFPQQWFHQCMLNVLLGTLDPSVTMPNTLLMDSGAAVPIDLWSSARRAEICDPQRLQHKSGLHHMVCAMKYLALVDGTMINQVYQEVLGVANTDLYENQKSSVLECAADAVWNDRTALLQFYNGTATFDPCSPLAGADFSFETRRTIRLQDISNAGLTTFLSACTSSVNLQAPGLAYRVDYVTNVPYPTDAASLMLPIVQVWGIDTSQMVTSAVDTVQWVSDACSASVPDPFVPPQQADLPADSSPCLYEEDEQVLDADRYLTDGRLVIRIGFWDDTTYEIPVCPWTSSFSSLLFFQTDQGQTDTDSNGVFLQPAIVSVEAPPGVYIRGYAGKATPAEWSRGYLPDQAINCAWTSTQDRVHGWWPGAVGASSTSTTDDLYLTLDNMGDWWPGDKTNWPLLGCGSSPGVIALEYALERSPVTGVYCSLSVPVKPMTPHWFSIRKPPQCGYDARGTPYRAFRLRDDSRQLYSLWKCMPCTRYSAKAVSDQGMFQCTLPNGQPLANLFTDEMLQSTFPFLYQPDALSHLVGMPARVQSYDNGSQVLFVLSPMQSMSGLGSLAGWGGKPQAAATKMWDATSFNDGLGYDSTFTVENEQFIWSKAVNNPGIALTMTCEGQQYTSSAEETCNPVTDARRQALAAFVEAQYRQTNGLWLPQVPQGFGFAFEANVAHSAVGKFSLFYASGDRPSEQVVSAWNLGSGPCASTSTTLEDRICVESVIQGGSHFEPMHPWVGGDFNPFASLDECPFLPQAQCLLPHAPNYRQIGTSNVMLTTMCACQCSPPWACAGTAFNYSADFMAAEFPAASACQTQAYVQTRTMYATDNSNLCSRQPQTQQSGGCATQQGVLGGGYVGRTVTATEMHSAAGVTHDPSLSTQTLLSPDENSLWTDTPGSTGFLSMPRAHIHPAHIAFGLDATLSTLPLGVKAIALLPQTASAPPSSWAKNLPLKWAAQLNVSLYPQLSGSSEGVGDWSCPIRKLVFWGSSTPVFGPVTPNPVVAALLYNLSGAHPFIVPTGPYPRRADYYTTNGICFYRQDPSTWPQIDIGSIESPCGLRGMLYLLDSEAEAGVSVQESFAARCNDIIDTPDAGGDLQSGETIPPAEDLRPQCGLLHRLTPALVSTNGTSAPLVPSEDTTTSSEGGDCHMGRLALVPLGALQGKHCSTVAKDDLSVTVFCPYSSSNATFPRARPLTLAEVVAKTSVVYRSDRVAAPTYPVFKGPGRVPLVDKEISFGQLYTPSLLQMLGINSSFPLPSPQPMQQQQQQSKDDALWNASDWLWSFNNHSYPRGRVTKAEWRKDRTGACNASLEDYIVTSEQTTANSVRRVSLCAPAPTPDLGTLCTAKTQFAVDLTQANCQAMGNGDCISNLGMFYLPYMWSNTNQDFSFHTVGDYYQTLIQTYFTNESYDSLCMANVDSSVLETLGKLSAAQNAICPASGLDVIKALLADLRTAGHDLLHLSYNWMMMCANLVGAAFTLVQGQGQVYLYAAAQYLIVVLQLIREFLGVILNILTDLLMSISTVGQGFRVIIVALCKAYNWWLSNVVSVVWCGGIRPAVIELLKIAKTLAFMSSDAVASIQQVLDVVGDGDQASCQRVYLSVSQMTCPSEDSDTYNMSAFQPQALATLCWQQQGGGGVFTGYSSVLTCTSSDTCAKDPLLFDDPSKAGLVYCGSCPASEGGARFGCDVYLQRCVCGTMPQVKSGCLTNADCQDQAGAMCGVGSRVENIRSSYISVSCSTCGAMSLSPICLIDGMGGGVCGCASVMANLRTCPRANLGQYSMLGLSASQLCPVVTDAAQQQMLASSPTPQAIAIDFSTLAIAQCNLGGHQNLCLNVNVPLIMFSTAENSYVVLLELLSILQQPGAGRRRLLSLSPQLLFAEWMQQHASHAQEECPPTDNRQAWKQCLYWTQLGAYTAEHFNLSSLHGPSLFFIQSGTFVSLLPHLYLDPDLRAFLIAQHVPMGKPLLEMGRRLLEMGRAPARHLLQQAVPVVTEPVSVSSRGDWNLNCSSVQIPFEKITSAFWDTVHLYQQNGSTATKEETCNASLGLSHCLGYELPPYPQSSSSMLSQVLLYVPTLGLGGDRVLNALLSDMPYEVAQESDYVTGRRVLQDMGTCNFTRLTLGPTKQRNFLAMFCFLLVLFTVVSYTCLPFSFCAWILWYMLFPVALFWCLYNISPLCWPMIPPRFIQDLHTEVGALFSTDLSVPRYLVRPHCTVDGRLSDGTYDASCFGSCSDPPFLFSSWQDTLIWWVCEASTSGCRWLGDYAAQPMWGATFKDLVSSADYYAQVIQFSYKDPELVQAHRLCAVLSLYNIVFVMLVAGIACYVVPSVLLAVAEVFMGCMILVLETYNLPEG